MNRALATTASSVAGVVITIAIATAAFWSFGKVSEVTNSGLFGICGPYGDEWSIWLQLTLLVVGLVGSPILGVICGRRIHRRFPA
ncbi:MAG: hypothetical protein QOE82_2056 [Thermoanaerobaculia bacterium]|jgi:hypothetical protein|nr:hypothetical protein [Thermoanaerobaculia bacterium]